MPFIPLEVFANNPSTTVSSGGTTAPAAGTAETWTVASSATFPAVETGATTFHVADPALPSEIITVVNISGVTWTVTRGAESTTPVAHAAGFTVVQVVTAGVLAATQYPAWQFPVQKYGAQGDGKIGTGGTGASGQAVMTDAGASFVNTAAPAGDVGKYIIVNQGAGGSATNPFCGTITADNSATSITLSGNLGAPCTAAPYVYGTDDAAAINAAVTAAAAWARTTGNQKTQIIFEPQLYMLGALTQSTSPNTWNTHIPVPFNTQYDRKLVIDLVGTGDAAEPQWWGSTIPNLAGTCLVSASFATGQPNGTYGQQSVIGTPSTTTGIGGANLAPCANVLVNIDGITVVTPYNASQHGFDFRFAAQVNVKNGAQLAFAPVNYSSQTCGGPYLRGNIPANGAAAGLAMPYSGNNDNSHVGLFSAEGISTGLVICEHFNAQRIATIYCDNGILITDGAVLHGGAIGYWSCEGGNIGLFNATDTSSQYPLTVALADFEGMNTYYVSDPNGGLSGTLYWADPAVSTPAGKINGAVNLEILSTRMMRGPWAAYAGRSIPAPPAAPSTGAAQQNTAYRHATVYASATTGITVVAVGPASTGLTTTGLTAGNAVTTSFQVPSGHWYSVTYTGVLTTKWVLE